MFKRFIQLLALIVVAIGASLLTGCGTMQKNIHKTERDSTASVSTSTATTVDTHTANETAVTRTTTEVTDTTVSVATTTNSIKIQVDNIRDTSYMQGAVKVFEHFDADRRILTIRTEYTPPPVTIYKTKTIYEKSNSKASGDQQIKQAVKTNTETAVHSKEKDKAVKRTSSWSWYLLFYCLGVATVFLIKMLIKYLKTVYFGKP